MDRVRILVVAKNVPWPANSGEKQRTLGVVRALRDLGDVTVVAFRGPYDEPDLAIADGITVRAVPQRTRRSPARLLRDVMRRRSITAGKWWDNRLAQAVKDEVARGVDVIVVGHVQLSPYLPPHLPLGTATVLDMHNIESLLTRRLARTTRSWKRWPMLLESVALMALERRATSQFDLVTVVSEADRVALRDVVHHDHVAVMPNAVDPRAAPLPHPGGQTSCFVGLMSWEPNSSAATEFTQQVWPAVLESHPDARLLLVGRDPTPQVRALASRSVEVTGTVADLTPYYAQSSVALAPLLAGGGSRLKILEALAHGRPVLATTVGAEGLDDLVGRGVVLADGPHDLARELSDLLRAPERCEALGRAGATAVREDHTWSAATAPLLRHLEDLIDA
jgi:glycosyltransferase involved in cell wall biosynthesis